MIEVQNLLFNDDFFVLHFAHFINLFGVIHVDIQYTYIRTYVYTHKARTSQNPLNENIKKKQRIQVYNKVQIEKNENCEIM